MATLDVKSGEDDVEELPVCLFPILKIVGLRRLLLLSDLFQRLC